MKDKLPPFLFLPIVIFSAAIGSTALAAEANAVAEAELWRCQAPLNSKNYISHEDLDRLRQMSRDTAPTSAAFSKLSPPTSVVVAEALRIGPEGAFFSARVLRDLVIINALDEQVRCGNAQCLTPSIISNFHTSDSLKPSGRSWEELRDLWIRFRDDDAKSALNCLGVSQLIPTAPGILPAPADERLVVSETVSETQQSGIGATPTNPAPQDVPSELVGLDPADLRFCLKGSVRLDRPEVSDEQVRQLREDIRNGNGTILAGMNAKYREALEEALRVGPSAGIFAYRTLRTLHIIKEINRQINCPSESTCPLSNDIQEIKRNDSWKEMLAVWVSIRDTDLQGSLACLNYSKTLPTLELAPAVAAFTDNSARDNRARCEDVSNLKVLTIRFAKNRSNAGERQLSVLSKLVALLQQCAGMKAFVAGYADKDGSRAYNLALSQARAESVAAYFIHNGASPGQVEGRGFGATRSVSKAQSRRVEIQLKKLESEPSSSMRKSQ